MNDGPETRVDSMTLRYSKGVSIRKGDSPVMNVLPILLTWIALMLSMVLMSGCDVNTNHPRVPDNTAHAPTDLPKTTQSSRIPDLSPNIPYPDGPPSEHDPATHHQQNPDHHPS